MAQCCVMTGITTAGYSEPWLLWMLPAYAVIKNLVPLATLPLAFFLFLEPVVLAEVSLASRRRVARWSV